MKYRRIIAAALAVFTLFTGATALAAGTAADPLVTKSHLEDVFNKPLEDYIETVFDTLQASFEAKTQGLQIRSIGIVPRSILMFRIRHSCRRL